MSRLSEAPDAVAAAFNHVRSIYPNVVKVEFASDLTWLYTEQDGKAPIFDSRIDVSLLEDALDSVRHLPVTYTVD